MNNKNIIIIVVVSCLLMFFLILLKPCSTNFDKDEFTVVNIINGNQIELHNGWEIILIGIESNNETYEYLEENVLNKKIKLTFDSNSPRKHIHPDASDKTQPAYVSLPSGICLNTELIVLGITNVIPAQSLNDSLERYSEICKNTPDCEILDLYTEEYNDETTNNEYDDNNGGYNNDNGIPDYENSDSQWQMILAIIIVIIIFIVIIFGVDFLDVIDEYIAGWLAISSPPSMLVELYIAQGLGFLGVVLMFVIQDENTIGTIFVSVLGFLQLSTTIRAVIHSGLRGFVLSIFRAGLLYIAFISGVILLAINIVKLIFSSNDNDKK